MRLLAYMSHVSFGMGLQAAISAALFPDGINPTQQLYASILFMFWSILFALAALFTTRRRNNG